MKDERKDTWKYEDPDPDDRGILLSDKIDKFCKVGLLISGDYEPHNLRPASYTLRIGDAYIDSNGKLQQLTDDKDSFIFEKNSIIFVSTKEKLELPFYVIARFNIRVTWVYDGVLLGTGPQVDPGFSGSLSCPLYNLTNLDITIKRGQDFATIDFEKTTKLLAGMNAEEKRSEIDKARDKTLVERDGSVFSFYRVPPLKPLQHRKAHRIVSSLFEMKEELRTWRRLGIGSVIAFFGLTLSLLGFGTNLYRQNADLNRQLSDTRSELQAANAKISNLESTFKRISSDQQSISPAPISADRIEPRKGHP